MRTASAAPLALLLVLGLSALPAAAKDKKPDIEPSVTYATSWDEAVAEAKLLNVPIVVHNHKFT